MASTNFQTNTLSYRQLFGNGLTYAIPPFQRDYSWGPDEWEDLWQDLVAAMEASPDDPGHYMGYIVLREVGGKDFEVIDGQQRLTTITLIVLAALSHLKKIADTGSDQGKSAQRAEALRQAFVGYRDPVSLLARSKLTLNRNNDAFFQNWLIQQRSPLPQRGLKASEKRLRDAFLFFERKLGEYIRAGGDAGEALAVFVERMSFALIFTEIRVTDDLNAYTVFETLNARGVKLSSTDLLKNYLFSVLSRGGADSFELRTLEERWERLLGSLESETFPVFVRAHWLSRHGLVRESALFKTIKARVTDRLSAFKLLEGMEEDVDHYLALVRPESSPFNPVDSRAAGLLKLFNVRQPYPVLMAARRRFAPAEFSAFLQAMVSMSFRFSVIVNGQSSELESAFTAEAVRIEAGDSTNAIQALTALRSIYVPDERFAAAFADVAFETTKSQKRKLVRYILSQIESQSGGTPPDIESDLVTVEHICPANPGEGWDAFETSDIDALAMRLGNLTLLERSSNNALGNDTYTDKRVAYQESAFVTTRKLAETYSEWTPATVVARQRAMASLALTIWKVGQLAQRV